MGGPDPCLRQMSGAVAKNRILVDAPPELAFERQKSHLTPHTVSRLRTQRDHTIMTCSESAPDERTYVGEMEN
jgi:hypothetical protein